MDNERRSNLIAEFRSLTKVQQGIAVDEILAVLNEAMANPKALIVRRPKGHRFGVSALTVIDGGKRP